MARHIRIAAGTLIACGLFLSMIFGAGVASAQSPAHTNSPAHVYVLTGFLGFQTRLHGAVNKVERGKVPVTVGHALEWSSMAASAIADYQSGKVRSVIIVGYSLGGGNALKMAAQLAEAQVPVALIVTVEPVDVSAVSPNVHRVVNYYLAHGWGSALHGGTNFHGSLRNIVDQNPNLDHFSLAIARENDVVNQVLSAAASSSPQIKSRDPSAAYLAPR
jgi:pimeloyl-ACP methyl ester carboxylesterase